MRVSLILFGVIFTGVLAGCGTGYNSGLVAQEWGTAYRLVVADQTLNPGAEKNLKPVAGLDNKAADKVMNKYEREFDKAPQVPIFTMGIPGALGAATSGTGTHY